MSAFFLFNNLHFALEFIGALAFCAVAWLAVDAFIIRKDFLTASRGIGFTSLMIWQVLHALNLSSEVIGYLSYIFYFFGIVFILWNLLLEKPVKRPSFAAVLILPALGPLTETLNSVTALGLLLITFLSFRQYQYEFKKSLFPFWLGFLFLSAGAVSSIFYDHDFIGAIWILGHTFELIGFFALGWWVWSYLQSRIREEMLLIFVSVTLFMAIVVSLTFSSVLINRIEIETKSSLLTDVKVFEYAIGRLKDEALAKTKFIADRPELAKTIKEKKFVKLDELAVSFFEKEQLGFLAILDKDGDVLVRAHGLVQRDDDLSKERAVARALGGGNFVTIETSPAEKFSIRAASPIFLQGKLIGVVVGGFLLDNLFVDSIKKITGLEMSVFEKNVRVATTAFNSDGRTRSVGITNDDSHVLDRVLDKGEEVTLRTSILARPFLASYIPLRNNEGRVVGMISAAKPQHEILETIQVTNRMTFAITMIIMLIMIMPIYIITRRLSSEV